jgi:hypothetical protein
MHSAACRYLKPLLFILLLLIPATVKASDCHRATITTPSPFLGDSGEIFQLDDGTVCEVMYNYYYIYENNPSVIICPSDEKMILAGQILDVDLVKSSDRGFAWLGDGDSVDITVSHTTEDCRDYFIADGRDGHYLLRRFDGYNPSVGDRLVGDLGSSGDTGVFYPGRGSSGRVCVVDYEISKKRAFEKLSKRCG